MLINHTRVLHWHLPPRKINHAGAELQMLFKERGAAHYASVRAS